MRKQVTRYNTSADFVYSELRAKILSKQLSPGTRLPEVSIAHQLKVSRTPVRDALRRMATEGLVTITLNRGARVAQPTAEEINGTYAVRQQLELMSVAEAAEKKLDKKISTRLTWIITSEQRASTRADTEALMDLENAFHKAIAEASKNLVLVEFIEAMLMRANVYSLFFSSFDERVNENISQHEEILNAILARDGALAVTLMKNHLRHSHSMLTIPEEQAAPKKRGRGRRKVVAVGRP